MELKLCNKGDAVHEVRVRTLFHELKPLQAKLGLNNFEVDAFDFSDIGPRRAVALAGCFRGI